MSDRKETKAALLSKLRKRNLIILRLSATNHALKKKIEQLEKKVEKLKRPPIHKRVWAFIKKILHVQ